MHLADRVSVGHGITHLYTLTINAFMTLRLILNLHMKKILGTSVNFIHSGDSSYTQTLSHAGITPVAYHRGCAIVYIVIHNIKEVWVWDYWWT